MTRPGGIDTLAPARRCLAFVSDYWDARGWDLPERRYLAAGEPGMVATDDEHCCVLLTAVTPGASDLSQRGGGVPSRGVGAVSIPRVSYAVRLRRYVAMIEDPNDTEYVAADVLTAEGAVHLADAGRLLSSLMAWREAETGPGYNATVTVGQIDPFGPMGGTAGVTAVVTLAPIG